METKIKDLQNQLNEIQKRAEEVQSQIDRIKASDNGSGIGCSGDGWILKQLDDDGGFMVEKLHETSFGNEPRYTDQKIAEEMAFAASIQFKIRAHPKWRGFVAGKANYCFSYDAEDEEFSYDSWGDCCNNAGWGYFATVADIDECRKDLGEENIARAMRAYAGLK